jgi:hypothetical protein
VRVRAHPGDHDPPQGVIGLAVAAGIEPVPGHLARGGRDRRGGAQVRPGGFGRQPAGVVPGGDEQHRGGVRADAEGAEQAGGAGGDQRDDQLVEAAELGAGELGAAAELAQRAVAIRVSRSTVYRSWSGTS